jgi:hypothetical protein
MTGEKKKRRRIVVRTVLVVVAAVAEAVAALSSGCASVMQVFTPAYLRAWTLTQRMTQPFRLRLAVCLRSDL